MERYKDDAVRREFFRIQTNSGDTASSIEQLVEKITKMEGEIRCCYDKEIEYSGSDLGWMMVRDACFLLEFFRCLFYDSVVGDELFKEDEGFQILQRFHPIFGSKSNPVVRSDIMKDLIKLENQIPLFVLEQVVAMEMKGSLENAKSKLQILLHAVLGKIYYRPFKYFAPGESPRQSHILDIYHYCCLGDEEPQGRDRVDHYLAAFMKDLEKDGILIFKVPSAVELKNGGVKIRAKNGNIRNIEYKGKTLSMPAIQLFVDSEIFIRNLIALEVCSPLYKYRNMTAYAQFMDELCQTDKGVGVMRDEGIIYGNLGHHSRIFQLWNSLNSSNLTLFPTQCPSIIMTRVELSDCYKRRRSIRYRSLWNEFWRAYGSKPWLVIGGIGATIILLLTAVQVFCLFRFCGAR